MEALFGFVIQTSLAIVLAAIRLAFVLGAIMGQVLRTLFPYVVRIIRAIFRRIARPAPDRAALTGTVSREGGAVRLNPSPDLAVPPRSRDNEPAKRRRNATKIYW